MTEGKGEIRWRVTAPNITSRDYSTQEMALKAAHLYNAKSARVRIIEEPERYEARIYLSETVGTVASWWVWDRKLEGWAPIPEAAARSEAARLNEQEEKA